MSACSLLTSPTRPATSQFGGPRWRALVHAASCATTLPRHRRDGFHAGVLGIAWAAARAALLLEEEELHARAVALSSHPGVRLAPIDAPISSWAWPVRLWDCWHSQMSLTTARLAEQAVRDGRDPHRPRDRHFTRMVVGHPHRRYPAHLCGVSHGAAGIGWALLELFAATGDERFRAAAIGAFAYERSWLDRVHGQVAGSAHRRPASWPACADRFGDRGHVVLRRGRHRVDAASRGCRRSDRVLIATTPRLRSRPRAGTSPTRCRTRSTTCRYAMAWGALRTCCWTPLPRSTIVGTRGATLATQFGYVMLERHADAGATMGVRHRW